MKCLFSGYLKKDMWNVHKILIYTRFKYSKISIFNYGNSITSMCIDIQESHRIYLYSFHTTRKPTQSSLLSLHSHTVGRRKFCKILWYCNHFKDYWIRQNFTAILTKNLCEFYYFKASKFFIKNPSASTTKVSQQVKALITKCGELSFIPRA